MGYSFHEQTGNLLSRSDNLRNLSETFTYDKLDRLEYGENQSGVTTLQVEYAANGNIQNKLDAGEYLYDGTKPHAVSAIKNYTADIPITQQDIAYTSFNKAKTITEGSNTLAFTYDCNHHRIKSLLTYNGNYKRDITYMGDFEQINQWGLSSSVNYISSPDGLAAMYVTVNGSSSMYYVNTDHLGSIDLVYKEGNNTAPYAEQSFDAWGRYRNPANWQTFQPTNLPNYPNWLIRGYTGHEHHKEFELINMNGRMYDPVLGRMLSPDNYVQSAGNTQNFNRYSYCLNNPLKYTDPSGDVFVIDDAVLGLIGGTINLVTNLGSIHNIGQGLGYFGVGFVGGALSEYITPVGAATLVGMGNTALGSYINTGHVDAGEVIMGGLQAGAMSIATAGLSNAVSSYINNALSKIASPVIRQALVNGGIGMGVGTITGGIGAGMNGGDIGQGMLQGAVWGLGIGVATGAYSGFRDAKAQGVAPWSGKSVVDKYYRAVSPGEFDDIQKNGLRPNPNGDGYQQEKLFATSPEDAQTWANDFQRIGGQNSTIIEVTVPQNANVQIQMMQMDSRTVIVIQIEQLNTINKIGTIRPFKN